MIRNRNGNGQKSIVIIKSLGFIWFLVSNYWFVNDISFELSMESNLQGK